MVPVVDLSRRGERFATAFAEAAARLARGGQFLLGDELEGFERELAGWLAAGHVAGVSSGASALQLALTAAGVRPGDEVLLPAFTAVPTASAVVAAGARPVVADVDRHTACVTPESIAPAITTRTRAVILVHLYGYPAPVDMTAAAGDHGLLVIEDAAQAMGALRHPTGSPAVAYSFYPTKNLGGIGDGGAVVSDDPAIDAQVRGLRAHGSVGNYVHDRISQNFRMSELEAAWLRLTLPALADDVAARRRIAATYREAAPGLCWQREHAGHAYHLCVFKAADRDAVRRRLAETGVATAVHYPLALTQQPAYLELFPQRCAEAEAWAAQCVSVPCFPEMTQDEIDHVAEALAGLPS